MNLSKWILCFLLCIDFAASAQETIRLSERKVIPIGKYVSYFIDKDKNTNPSNVVQKSFVANHTDNLSLGPQQVPVWVKFKVQNEIDENLFLELGAPLLETVELYSLDTSGLKQLFSGGMHLPFKARQINVESWLFDLDIPPHTGKEFYLKVASGYPLQIPMIISDKNSYQPHNQKNTLFWGLYIGVALFALIYNFFIYLSVRERTYLFYILYVLFSSSFYLGLAGYHFKYLYPNSPSLNIYLVVLILLNNIMIPLFIMEFLQITRKRKFLYWFGMGLVIFFALLLVASFFIPFGLTVVIAQTTSLIECTYAFLAGVMSLRSKVFNARFFLPAWILFIISLFIFILTDQNVLPSNFFNSHSLFIGHMAELLLISFALADRINQLKKENETKQKQIIFQLEENEKIQLKANRELEQKVKERTSELVEEKNKLSEEKAHSDSLLLNILPSEIAEELKKTGAAQARQIDTTTVLFADFKDFTRAASNLNPQQLVHDINEYFTAFDHIMDQYNIEKIKTIGDAYMAAGGVPHFNAASPVDTVNAGLAMIEAVDKLNLKRAKLGNLPFEVRIGINSGPVVAGIVGIKKFAYDIWGDTVNIASRMETSGEPGRVNISSSTYNLVKDHFICTFRGKIEAKNLGQIDMYFVERKTI